MEERHPESTTEGFLEKRVEVGDIFRSGAPAQIRVHAPTLDRTGADERDLDNEVVKFARLEAWESRDLRT